MKPVIKLKNVWKIYHRGEIPIPALRGINLDINQGDFVAITGASGSGKSTMMNIIGCLDTASKGTIYLDNKDISLMPESRLSEIRGKKIGFIFQQFNLIPTLSALDNVMLPMEFQDVPIHESKKRAERVLTLVGLKDRIHHRPSELSGGEAQRVAIARALANDPEIVLADEPTGNLDSKTGAYIMKFLSDLHKKQKKTVVMITHDLHLAKFAKKIVQLKDGQIIRRKNR